MKLGKILVFLACLAQGVGASASNLSDFNFTPDDKDIFGGNPVILKLTNDPKSKARLESLWLDNVAALVMHGVRVSPEGVRYRSTYIYEGDTGLTTEQLENPTEVYYLAEFDGKYLFVQKSENCYMAHLQKMDVGHVILRTQGMPFKTKAICNYNGFANLIPNKHYSFDLTESIKSSPFLVIEPYANKNIFFVGDGE